MSASQKNQYHAYAAATHTVARTKQIVMLYDGAIRQIQQAKAAIETQRIEERYHALVRACDIISGLQGCLDFENGGDIAKILFSFYANIELRIHAIHTSNQAQACDEVIADLKQMRDVWQEIDHNPPSSTPKPADMPSTAVPQRPKSPDQGITLSA